MMPIYTALSIDSLVNRSLLNNSLLVCRDLRTATDSGDISMGNAVCDVEACGNDPGIGLSGSIAVNRVDQPLNNPPITGWNGPLKNKYTTQCSVYSHTAPQRWFIG